MKTIGEELHDLSLLCISEVKPKDLDFMSRDDWRLRIEIAIDDAVRLVQRRITLDEELPSLGVSVILFNDAWKDEDFNPDGVRIGFRQDDGFTSAHWWNYQDCYMTISKSECDGNPTYSDVIKNTTEPTHWRPIEVK